KDSNAAEDKPSIPPGITEYFAHKPDTKQPTQYQPMVAGISKLHFVDAKSKVDTWKEVYIVASAADDGKSVQWDQGDDVPDLKKWLEKAPLPNSTFEDVPAGLLQEKNYAAFTKALALSLYQNQALSIFTYPQNGMLSNPGESETDFRSRVALSMREDR